MLAVLVLLGGCRNGDREGNPRTVILVVVDTLRAEALGTDAVRKWSVDPEHPVLVYERAYSSSGWTLPSVASILTGVDPEVHHAHGKATLLAPLSPDVTTLAEAFRSEGFRTVAVTNAAFLSPLLGLDRGFDVYDHEHAYNQLGRRADRTVERALEYLADCGDDDVFLFVHLFDPHLDYDPTAEKLATLAGEPLSLNAPVTLSLLRELESAGGPTATELRDIRLLYDLEASAALEAAFAMCVDAITEERLAGLSFVLTADHGEEFFEHAGFEHGHSLHTELVHVPLYIHHAGDAPTGTTSGVVSTRDLGRHLLEHLELPVPESFAPSTSDWNGTGGGTAYAATTLYGPDRIALRTDTHSVLLELREGQPALGATYDLTRDPGEQHALPIDAALRRALLDRRNANRAAGTLTQRLDWQDLGPSKFAERDTLLESLESLGYTSSERSEDTPQREDDE